MILKNPNRNKFGGTRIYMPPEKHLGQQISKMSDIWGVGCIITELLGKRIPIMKNCRVLVIKEVAKDAEIIQLEDQILTLIILLSSLWGKEETEKSIEALGGYLKLPLSHKLAKLDFRKLINLGRQDEELCTEIKLMLKILPDSRPRSMNKFIFLCSSKLKSL